jgi:hypothetical protein
MRLLKNRKYRLVWLDAVQEASWAEDKDIDKLVQIHEKGVTQDLTFIKSSKYFNIFTSGVHGGDKSYFDLILIPKVWTKTIKLIK